MAILTGLSFFSLTIMMSGCHKYTLTVIFLGSYS